MELKQVVTALRKAQRVVALTGAGVSAESGIPTFRGADGLWRKFRAEELATPEAFSRNPALVWEWYDERRRAIAGKEPNPAHHTLARWEKRFPGLALITQNVDGLHRRAGSQTVIAVHGDIWQTRCTREGLTEMNFETPLKTIPPHCSRCGALLRPHVVWFGEPLQAADLVEAERRVRGCDLLLVIGTSGMVYPVAGFPQLARQNGATVVEINPQDTPLTPLADIRLRGKAGEILPEIDHAL